MHSNSNYSNDTARAMLLADAELLDAKREYARSMDDRITEGMQAILRLDRVLHPLRAIGRHRKP